MYPAFPTSDVSRLETFYYGTARGVFILPETAVILQVQLGDCFRRSSSAPLLWVIIPKARLLDAEFTAVRESPLHFSGVFKGR